MGKATIATGRSLRVACPQGAGQALRPPAKLPWRALPLPSPALPLPLALLPLTLPPVGRLAAALGKETLGSAGIHAEQKSSCDLPAARALGCIVEKACAAPPTAGATGLILQGDCAALRAERSSGRSARALHLVKRMPRHRCASARAWRTDARWRALPAWVGRASLVVIQATQPPRRRVGIGSRGSVNRSVKSRFGRRWYPPRPFSHVPNRRALRPSCSDAPRRAVSHTQPPRLGLGLGSPLLGFLQRSLRPPRPSVRLPPRLLRLAPALLCHPPLRLGCPRAPLEIRDTVPQPRSLARLARRTGSGARWGWIPFIPSGQIAPAPCPEIARAVSRSCSEVRAAAGLSGGGGDIGGSGSSAQRGKEMVASRAACGFGLLQSELCSGGLGWRPGCEACCEVRFGLNTWRLV
eukprot:scaffold5583_cov106-Isochrysis_galbana.AAC.2